MANLKCKMCGGNLEVTESQTICTCEYCGTTQTVPLIDSDKKARLFNRANDYRLNNDFDRAYNTYEAIINENPNEAEAYWGMVLSEYGVEYVEDPKSHKRIPTCHRTLVQSVFSNSNYKKAIELADIESKLCYQDEAEELDKLEKSILSVSSKEEPYDAFISYKESDNEGNRTKDSVIAQDLYDDLTSKGLRVFFSRISLEDKFGQNYEPYIYNALRTSKVMLLVTTSNENSNAPWVRNEWLRFLDFIRNDSMKSLIPVIKDMNPYELPDELQKLQVLDLNKIGSKQDLIRGVLKIVGKDSPADNQRTKERKNENATEANNIPTESSKRDVKNKSTNKETDKKKSKTAIILISLIFIVAAICIYIFAFAPANKYQNAKNLMNEKHYDEAIVLFNELGTYKDSEDMITESKYQISIDLYESGDVEKAFDEFKSLNGYKESSTYMNRCNASYVEKILDNSHVEGITDIFRDGSSKINSVDYYFDSVSYAKIVFHIEATASFTLYLFDGGVMNHTCFEENVSKGSTTVTAEIPYKYIVNSSYAINGWCSTSIDFTGFSIRNFTPYILSKDLFGNNIYELS